jgi:integrase
LRAAGSARPGKRVRNLRAKLPHLNGEVSYTDQHSFVTDALENGVGVAQVAELLGHTSTDIVIQHYQHLREKREHLKQAAIQATQGNGNQAGPASKAG